MSILGNIKMLQNTNPYKLIISFQHPQGAQLKLLIESCLKAKLYFLKFTIERDLFY